MDFFKKLRLRQIVTIFLAGMLLVVNTACSGANAQAHVQTILPFRLAVQTTPISLVEMATQT
jgi:hypothetical protein